MTTLSLAMSNGTVVRVPASLDSITTYILLEQESWFEKELGFLDRWLRPGMTVIDIGANLGVYSLSMARRVGPAGRVVAYEPAAEACSLLRESRDANRIGNLEIVTAALSDGEREGYLGFAVSSELRQLDEGGSGELVRVIGLDLEDASRGWAPDFIKIDAEGEEERILRGGPAFFARHSPLVMFEILAGETVNQALRTMFPALGYGVYRLLPGAPVLVPDAPNEPVDTHEVNLFAAKRERAAVLAREGFLVETLPVWRVAEGARRGALGLLRTQRFAAAFAAVLGEDVPLDSAYRDALAAYAAWRAPTAALPDRCAALEFAWRSLAALCHRDPGFPRISTLARVAWEAGRLDVSVQALNWLVTQGKRGTVRINEPFWPACAHYDHLSPGQAPGEWFLAAAAEQMERIAGFSSMFAGCTADLEWLCRTPFASTEMVRRIVLNAARKGRRVEVPKRLCRNARDHCNAEVWRCGGVPNTVVARQVVGSRR